MYYYYKFITKFEGGCKRPCDFRLQCGHQCPQLCHVNDRLHESIRCRKRCPKKCPESHACKHKCYECSKECPPCEEMVEKKLPNCNHVDKMKCHRPPESFHCTLRSDQILPCGHQSHRKCHDARTNPIPERCEDLVASLCPLNHPTRIQCSRRNEPPDSYPCLKRCSEELPCGDMCGGTCSGCLRGRLHEPCRAKCHRLLVCGHECLLECPARCGPCSRRCENYCEHSMCKLQCGEACAPCQERCTWKCRHHKCTMPCSAPCNRPPCNERCMLRLRCRHLCAGLCGEKCPRLCYRCDYKQLTEIFFGTEDTPNARFIELEDCGHIFEVSAFDKYIGLDSQNTSNSKTSLPEAAVEIQLQTCPLCKRPIRKSGRYKSIINKILRDIELVKQRVRGELFPGNLRERFLQLNLEFLQSLSSSPHLTFFSQLIETYNSSTRNRDRRIVSADSIAYLQSLVSFFNATQRLDQLLNSQCSEESGKSNTSIGTSQSVSSALYVTSRKNLIHNIKALEGWLRLRRQRFSELELKQLEAEHSRANHWINLLRALHCWQSYTNNSESDKNGMPKTKILFWMT